MSTRLSIDVSTLPGWSSVTSGSHTLTIVAKATGYRDSEPSAGVTITKAVNYTITATAMNAICTPFVATVTSGGSQAFSASADGTSYKLPTSITVAGTTVNAGSSQTITGKCTVLYTRTNDTSGSIAFSDVTDDISFSVVGEEIRSGYTVNITDRSNFSAVTIYDGVDTSAPELYTGFIGTGQTVTVISGNLYIHAALMINFGETTTTGGVIKISGGGSAILFAVTGDGTIDTYTFD